MEVPRPAWPVWVTLWFCLSIALVAPHWHFFTAGYYTELGDWGANALQIYDAKHFQALYGNYSRWGFNHPGPLFFYVYAWGEVVLYDWLHAVSCPYNAHATTGILLQAGFFVWALAIVQRSFPNRIVWPVLLLLGGIHFGAVNYWLRDTAFVSIWPPHVLLCPFLCLIVACAALASGESRAILPAAIAGSFLVHGHVAQPLFVGPFFIGAVIAVTVRARIEKKSARAWIRRARPQVVGAGLVLVAAILPLALDLLKGKGSNLAVIAGHFGRHPGERKTLLQSIMYLLSFFSYHPNPEDYCDSLNSSSLAMFAGRMAFLGGWALVFAGLLILWKTREQRSTFLNWLALYFAAGIGLTLCWGTLQTGPLYNFNSHFNFGLLFVPLILLALLIAERKRLVVSALASSCYVLTALVIFVGAARSWHFDSEFGNVSSNLVKVKEVKETAAGSLPGPIFLSFGHDKWPLVVGVAVELRRLGFSYAVPAEEALIFGRKNVRTISQAVTTDHLTVWDFAPRLGPTKGFVGPGNLFASVLPSVIEPVETQIRFCGEDLDAGQFAMWGWALSTGPYSWSVGPSAVMYVRPSSTNHDVEMLVNAFPFTPPELPAQRLTVRFNETQLTEEQQTGVAGLRFVVPRDLWNRSKAATITFEFPDAASPLALGVSADPRELGYGFKSVQFHQL